MIRTFGEVADTAPEHFLGRRVHFTTLVRLDEGTKEGILTRTIASSGFGVRELPLPITGNAQGRGHEGAAPVGRLDKVSIDGNNVEAWGWLLDDANGRQVFHELATGVVRGTSIEMTDVRFKVSFDWPLEEEMPKIDMLFTESNVGATTFVMKPAFKDARGVLEEEVTAALAIEGDLEVDVVPEVWVDDPEVTAASRIALEHEAFSVPEPSHHQPWKVDPDTGWVCGHLGRYGEPHTGLAGRVTIPRSRTNYASYCKREFPTTEGRVFTGPIILLGGHKATAAAINDALADPANSWADVVVRDGKIGPWVCGKVRPGVSDAALHAAMGSGISGHWKNGELYAICSVNAEGFDVPRPTGWTVEAYDEDGDEYMAASFVLTEGEGVPAGVTSIPLVPDYEATLAAARAALEDEDAPGQEGPDLSNPDAVATAVLNRLRESGVSVA